MICFVNFCFNLHSEVLVKSQIRPCFKHRQNNKSPEKSSCFFDLIHDFRRVDVRRSAWMETNLEHAWVALSK